MMRLFLSIAVLACTICTNAQTTFEHHGFKALLNGKIQVEIAFETAMNDGEQITAGYIYYPKAKTPAPILIVKDGDHFTEFQPDGEITGLLTLAYTQANGVFRMQKGSWKNPTTGKVLQLSKITERNNLPNWWPGSPAVLTAPGRDAWEFGYHVYNKETGASEDMNTINVIFRVNDKYHPLSFEESLNGTFDRGQDEQIEWVCESDINFDGIPDVMVYLGMTPSAQSLYKAFVWNPVTRQFYPVSAFDEIQEPFFDKTKKTITSTARSYTKAYIDVYKWKNGKLNKVSSKEISPVE